MARLWVQRLHDFASKRKFACSSQLFRKVLYLRSISVPVVWFRRVPRKRRYQSHCIFEGQLEDVISRAHRSISNYNCCSHFRGETIFQGRINEEVPVRRLTCKCHQMRFRRKNVGSKCVFEDYISYISLSEGPKSFGFSCFFSSLFASFSLGASISRSERC